MRFAVLAVVVLVGCAHGNPSQGDVDASPDSPPTTVPDCDGLPCDAIYVAPAGSDAAAGTKDAPILTIAGKDVPMHGALRWFENESDSFSNAMFGRQSSHGGPPDR